MQQKYMVEGSNGARPYGLNKLHEEGKKIYLLDELYVLWKLETRELETHELNKLDKSNYIEDRDDWRI